jgi:carbon monoxide dehydrogenase subunit G
MQFTGEYRIPVPRAQVWQALNDPEILKVCIDGCEELQWAEDGVLDAVVRAKVGPVHARFKGTITLTDVQPGVSYVLIGEGKGGAAGFAKGQAAIRLRDDGAETVLEYDAGASIGGKIATVGSRLISGVANKFADEFFQSFTNRLLVALKMAEMQALVGAEEAVHKHDELDLGDIGMEPMTPVGEEDEEVAALLRAVRTDEADLPALHGHRGGDESPAREPGRYLPITPGLVIIVLGWGFMVVVLGLLLL